MMSTKHRTLAIKLFGAQSAANALMTLGYLLDKVGESDLDSAVPYLIGSDFDQLRDSSLEAMQLDGLDNQDEYLEQMNAWRAAAKDMVENGAPTVERSGYDPVNIGSAFHDGKLYYPVQTLVRTEAFTESGHKRHSEQVDVIVVRSDRSLLNVEESEDANGKRSGIIRLADGTLLQKRPAASPYASWSWDSIQDYLQGSYTAKSISVLAMRIHKHLMSRVWLPDEDDYWLLTCAAITSYIQAIFDAVPLILLCGVHGTGKSELGAGMTEVSCNSVMIGQSSPSTMLRVMDEARGLIVVDDLESVGVKGGAAGKEKFSEMVQLLKTSYKKISATKIVTNAKRKTEVMNFFGVKIISNTKGVDAILGSRMLHIATGSIPKSSIGQFLARQGLTTDELISLRNDLHIWAFDNVRMINSAYQEAVQGSSERDEEIAAPLRVVAGLIDAPGPQESLGRALSNQSVRKQSHSSPEDALRAVMDKLVLEGAHQLTIVEISLRLRRLMGVKVDSKKKLTWMQSEWISKKVRSLGYVDVSAGRKNLFGFQMRIVNISKEKRFELQAFATDKRDPFAFCSGCINCPFKALGCEILPYRVDKEGLI